MIQKGLRWRIGNGENVQIYNSKWIPRPVTFEIVSQPLLPAVSFLINEEHRWDENKIRQHFMPEDIERILQIPLPRYSEPDQLVWAHDKLGIYSVKSGYQVALGLKFPNCPSTSRISLTEWNVIWKLEIPAKVKIFIWRAAQNLLATGENLWKRKVAKEPWCQRCGSKVENVFHALIECKASQKMWKHTKFKGEFNHLVNQDMLSVLLGLAVRRNIRDMEMIVALCWASWHSRNLFVFEKKIVDVQRAVARAEAIVESYIRDKVPQRQDDLKQMSSAQPSWNPPLEGWFKLNVDAAINSKNQLVGL